MDHANLNRHAYSDICPSSAVVESVGTYVEFGLHALSSNQHVFILFSAVEVGFNDTEISVNEMEGSVSVCLGIGNVLSPTEVVVWVDISSSEGTAGE